MGYSRNENIIEAILNGITYKFKPQSRMEVLLIDLGEMIKKGGATPDQIEAAVTDYLTKHPVQPGEMDAGYADLILKQVYEGGTV